MTTLAQQSTGYVLVTAAYNEAAYIEKPISSVIAQTVLPTRWVIVSDGSNDGTDEIASKYARQYPFIELLRITEDHPRNFVAQVNAINRGVRQLHNCRYDFIGNLDADVSFDSSYFERLLGKFDADPLLGLVGGSIFENSSTGFRPRSTNSVSAVAHAVQLFRRQCYEQCGGYTPLPYGGPDWYAEVTARMKGWQVRSFPDLPVYHHRPTGTAGGLLKACFRQGRMDFSFGTHPAFEILKLARRLPSRPVGLGALFRAAGFIWSWLRREPRSVPAKFAEFLRREQIGRLRLGFAHLIPKAVLTSAEPYQGAGASQPR